MEIFVFFMQVFGTGLLSPTALELCSLATEGTQEITERTEIIPSQAKSLSLTDDTDCTDGSLLWRELGPTEIAEMAERFIAADAAGCCKRSGCFFYAAAIDGEGHNP